MKLLFVRHGHPDYANDCLTEKGRVQAEAVSKRLVAEEDIKQIFSSSYGRAKETAAPTAEKLGMPVTILDFMHEVSWKPVEETSESKENPQIYHPWLVSRAMTKEGIDLLHIDQENLPCWTNSTLKGCYERIVAESDNWMESLGYRREGIGYRCIRENEDNVALFAHHGSGTCLFSHLMNVPLFYLFAASEYTFTGITEFCFKGKEGEFVLPELNRFNDHGHVTDLEKMLMM